MKPKTMILMVVAVVCGLGASYMTSRVIAERGQNNAADEEKVTVLVARQKVPMGTLIKDPQHYFVEKAYTKGEEPKKALKTWDQLKEKRLNKPLSEDQFVTADDLMDPKLSGMDAIVPPGMRAVSIKVNVASVVAGFVLPNSRVDVVQTLRQGEHSATQTILQNVVVLASDGIKDRPDDKGNMPASTVTLAAKPEDVQKLRLAEAIGELSLSLRGAEDEEIAKVKATRPPDLAKSSNKDSGPNADDPNSDGGTSGGGKLSGVPDVPPVGPAPAVVKADEPPPPAPPKTVTQLIYNGESVTKTVFVLKEGEVTTSVERTGLEPAPKVEKPKTQPEPEPEAEPKTEPKANGDKAPAGAPAKKGAHPATAPGAAK
jgi:pilus assembly protein CpaB